jgi:putative addiction module component (TIGR02574 family)
MTKTAIRKGLRELPIQDRAEILDELVHLDAADQHELALSQWQKDLLDRRLARYEANPKNVISGSEFQKKLREKVKRMRTSTAKTKRINK